MHTLTHTETTAFSKEQIFALVADIERYPEFLPWCKAARILKKESDNVLLAELVIGFKGITERYTSHVMLEPHHTIHAELVKGPFEHLMNLWKLSDTEDGRTQIDLELEFQFKTKLLDSLIGGLFERASEKMTSAFRERAHELYD